ncbi:MAG: GNAT family N-acetyltransferase [Gemmatimonadota bacterium]|nr:MAG: GNAT family N-acetyltransferase [Gemmatimonadota bacterium]
MATDPSAAIELLQPGELPEVVDLLRRAALPPDDLEHHQETLLVARSASRVVGCAGLELYGESALLRSVAVEADWRGRGLGVALTRAALDLAGQRGVRRVYLLTETAGEFFPRFGFRSIERAAAPPEVQQSVEFMCVCPETAEAMLLELEPGGR